MATRRESGCDDLRWPDDPQLIERALIQCFMPVLYFNHGERFLPVDLQWTIRSSSLWHAYSERQPPTAVREKRAGAIDPVADLPATTESHFTTVFDFTNIANEVLPQPPFQLPLTLVDEVYQKYSGGTVRAELTIYATVCCANRVANAHLFNGAKFASKDVADTIQRHEALIINYYMYFPAYESLEVDSEGDWSGISLLIPARPTLNQAQNLNNPGVLKNFLPVVTAYYRKTIGPSPSFVAANGGFRRWSDVKKVSDRPGGPETHPIVYVSDGRHNCYYQPRSGPVSTCAPWSGFTVDGIENGEYTPGPADDALQGGEPDPRIEIPLEVIFPPLFFFHMCASGCQYPVQFDSSGVVAPSSDANDTTASETSPGDTTVPASAGDPYPQGGRWPGGGPPPRQLALRLEYVDLTDAGMAGLWRFPGAWGAATQVYEANPSDPDHPNVRGYFGGVRRPALAAWFLWNLFLDSTFGCGGKSSVTQLP